MINDISDICSPLRGSLVNTMCDYVTLWREEDNLTDLAAGKGRVGFQGV